MKRTTALTTLALSTIATISATSIIITTTQHHTQNLYATNTSSTKPASITAISKQPAPETPAPAPAQTLGSSTTNQSSVIKQHTTTTVTPAVPTTITPAHQQAPQPSKQVTLASATLSDWINGTHVDSTCDVITVTSPSSISHCTHYTRGYTPQKQYCIYTYSNGQVIRALYSTREAYDDNTYSNPSPSSFTCDTSTPPTIQ